ncbi:MAG TPA: hypothetical protein VL463_17920 [Kofleriaceae bacterium]|nr:hypothetical protein [Kofleriaceae bacterium]
MRHAWLQKHATPSSASGDFHWHPSSSGDPEIAERARGCLAFARLAPGRVVWARSFDEIAPADGRRYAGLVVSVIEGDASAAALLASVPWIEAPYAGAASVEEDVEIAEPGPLSSSAFLSAEVAGAAAHALRCGDAFACESIEPSIARALATLDTWIDPSVRARTRDVSIKIGAPAAAPALDHYAGAAWRACASDPARARRVWRAALALAQHDGLSAETLFDELAALVDAWDRAADLDAWLARTGVIDDAARAACVARGVALSGDDAGWLWNKVVHAWGRGCFETRASDRIAGALARRILADHLIALERDAPPLRYWRRLRWEAMLPADRRAPLEAGVRARIGSLIGGARG